MQKNLYFYNTVWHAIFAYSANVNDYDIKTSSGIVVGKIKNNVIYWDDIPYAKPPVGDLR